MHIVTIACSKVHVFSQCKMYPKYNLHMNRKLLNLNCIGYLTYSLYLIILVFFVQYNQVFLSMIH